MFHPSSNRFAHFLEVSSLFISLARTGGCQVKAGFLRIHVSGNKGPFGRRGIGWFESMESRWCAVRDNCLVVVVESGEVLFFLKYSCFYHSSLLVNTLGRLFIRLRFQDRTAEEILPTENPSLARRRPTTGKRQSRREGAHN
jgi:hypothetical protein